MISASRLHVFNIGQHIYSILQSVEKGRGVSVSTFGAILESEYPNRMVTSIHECTTMVDVCILNGLAFAHSTTFSLAPFPPLSQNDLGRQDSLYAM
jgi:hypothetical protein